MKMQFQHNEFKGSYYHEHYEMKWSDAPIRLKIMFISLVVVFFVGVVMLFVLPFTAPELLVTFIIVLLGLIFLMVAAFIFVFGSVQKIGKTSKLAGGICIGVGVLLLLVAFMIHVANPFLLAAYGIGLGIEAIFLTIGICIIVSGCKQKKHVAKNCTKAVIATCLGYENLQIAVPILNDGHEQRVAPKTGVCRPVWEYEYNGIKYRSTSEQYTGGLKIKQGDRYRIVINPNNPKELFCEENGSYKGNIIIGIVFIVLPLLFLIPIYTKVIPMFSMLSEIDGFLY